MKFNVKRATATVLLAAMLVGSAPVNVFAEQPKLAPTKINTSVRAVDTPDWEVSDEEASSDYWQLSGRNRLITVSPADPIKNPTIEYAGSYNLGEREVIRIVYRTTSSASAVWQRLLLKFDADLDNMIDWDHSQTVAYKSPQTDRESTDIANTKNGTLRFSGVSRKDAGSDHVHGILLNDAVLKNTVIESGMHFVLKSPEELKKAGLPSSLKELAEKKEPVIQSRITDSNFERVLRLNSKYIQGYSSYTSSTVIPSKNYGLELNHEGQNKTRTASPRFNSQTSFISYNKEKGWVDLTLRHHKKDFTGLENTIGLRTVIEDKFFDALAGSSYTDSEGKSIAENPEETIADIFILNKYEDPWEGTYNEPASKRKISFKRNRINKVKGTNLNFIQAVGSGYQNKYPEEESIKTQSNGKAFDTLVNGAVRTDSIGYSTVIRFYVNKDKFEKLMQGQDLLDMTYYTVFTNQSDKAKDVFEGVIPEDITIKPGDKDSWPVIATPTNEFAGTAALPRSKKNMVLEIGKRPNSITYSSDSTQDTTVYWGANDRFWFKTPYEMTLKKGTPIRLTMEGVEGNFKEITIFENLTEKNKGASGKSIVKLQRKDAKDGSMEFIRNSYNLKRPTVGVTQNEASIPEIFTTDDVFYGHTKSGNAIVRAYGVADDNKLIKQAYLSDANDTYKESGDESIIDVKNSQAVIVNKKLYNGYEFSTNKAVNENDPLGSTDGVENKKYKTVKDAPIAFTTEDYSLNSLEKLPPIIEQVQAKVKFDLNGGYLGNDPNAENATKAITKIAPLNENYRYVVGENKFPTATLNTNYKANAFEGDHRRMVADENGKMVMASHDGQVLGKEIYKTAFDKFEERLKERLDIAKNNPDTSKAVKASEVKEAEQDLESFKKYVEKFYTSEDIDITKSQLWLREFPGKESQADLKTENPKMDNKEFYGWTTKKVETVKDYNDLEELKTEEQAKDTTKTYKFTENSPILTGTTVYAFYGPVKSQVTNPKQTYDPEKDKQYIEIAPEAGDTLAEKATYKLVTKNEDGTYTPVEGLTATTKEDGTPVFDITKLSSDKFNPEAEYVIETTETGKDPSYSAIPIKIDKKGPKFVGDGENGLEVTQDPYGYQITVAATAQDDSGILRVYIGDNKNDGYYQKDASQKSGGFEATLQNQQGEEKTITVTAVDKFGNKTPATHTFKPIIKDIVLETMRPRAGKNFVTVTSAVGATIKVELNGVVIGEKILASETEKITLNQKLTKGDRLVITATLDGNVKTMKSRVR
ncbi:hypothetical protein BA93_07455 [Finegoldia magna ALB8]|uniref:hypothetical protein n=1 Tax=Finegoldia magna TaxID=1260 RepID=UPI0004538E8F|nr:hypothetical protein [Finegoldia magna]EXF27123.1 hypothetical protein BA93_07455 [Finegoldia magna ALB8]